MSRLEEIKHDYKNGFPVDIEWLISRVEELEEENKRLNYEIGSYSGDIHEKARIVIQESIELQEMAKKMLKGESE